MTDMMLTGVERFFGEDEVVVSKTDLAGRITYANRVFQRVAGFSEAELIGKPHNLIRHPDMPRCAFKLLWDTIEAGQECFAYVVNRARNGDHYWVFTHVTPSLDAQGRIVAYHSNRRTPNRRVVEKVIPLYQALVAEEQRHEDRKEGIASSFNMVVDLLTQARMEYHEWLFSL
ncbi:MAG: PAS domain-containing protein [Rhodospirillales bacterium]|nr:PAS domain-containing protein [Rhodospirillales bacterium]